MNKIKYDLWRVDNSVYFRVTHMPEHLRNKKDLFRLNYCRLGSWGYPELQHNVVCLPGSERTSDNRVARMSFHSTAMATDYLNKVDNILKQFNLTLGPKWTIKYAGEQNEKT